LWINTPAIGQAWETRLSRVATFSERQEGATFELCNAFALKDGLLRDGETNGDGATGTRPESSRLEQTDPRNGWMKPSMRRKQQLLLL
jgi:hypothetical protein